MNQAKINELKEIAEKDGAAYRAEQSRLKEAGFRSKELYELLKPLKSVADASWAKYEQYARNQIKKALDKEIAKQTPAERKEGKRRAKSAEYLINWY